MTIYDIMGKTLAQGSIEQFLEAIQADDSPLEERVDLAIHMMTANFRQNQKRNLARYEALVREAYADQFDCRIRF